MKKYIKRFGSSIRSIVNQKIPRISFASGVVLYRSLVEGLPILICCFRKNGKIIYVNKAYCRYFGKRREELIGKNFLMLIPEEDRDFVESQFASLTAEKPITSYEHRVLDAAGDIRWQRWTDRAILDDRGRILAYVSIGEDITEQKQAEEDLRESEVRYRTIFEQSPIGVSIFNAKGKLIEMNKAAREIFGVKDYAGLPKIDMFRSPNLTEEMKEKLLKGEAIRSKKKNDFKYDFEKIKKLGIYDTSRSDKIYIEMHVVPISYVEGQPPGGYLFLAQDRTENHKDKKEIEKLNQFLETTIDSANLWLSVSDENRNLIIWNKTAEEITGYKREEVIGDNRVWDWLYPDKTYLGQIKSFVDDIIESKEIADGRESTILTKDGKTRTMAWHVRSIFDKEKKILGIISLGRDVTESKAREQERQKEGKLESLGILAGGLAHDFNNILTSVLGNISIAKTQLNPEDQLHKIITRAEAACMRATGLTQQLLTFSQGGAPILETTSIEEIIKDSAKFALSGSNVSCNFSSDEDLWPAEVDPGQISQVISNLVINSCQAMPDGGIININARNFTTNGNGDDLLALEEGNYIMITVRDNGTGISEKHLDKVFDPYFTTKQKGSGLGLATAYSIIKNHGGHINVESKLGEGTTFNIYLKSSDKEVVLSEIEEPEVKKGQGKILVMDDEEIVREVASAILEELGYKAESSQDGVETLVMYQEALSSGRPFDAVIMDLTIPGGMGGKQAIKELLKIDPHAKVIVSSGYSDEKVMSDYKKYGFSGVIAKPYRIMEMSKKLHEVLMPPDK